MFLDKTKILTSFVTFLLIYSLRRLITGPSPPPPPPSPPHHSQPTHPSPAPPLPLPQFNGSCSCARSCSCVCSLLPTSTCAPPPSSSPIPPAQNDTCGDVYFSGGAPKQDKFSVIATGLTGSGKSTLLDMLAGGTNMSAVGSEYGYSETEEACLFHFEYLGGQYTAGGAEHWQALDTPGFDDTGGQEHDIRNFQVVNSALLHMREADAILLLWKYDEKFTDANLGAFLALRSVFDATIWKRVVLVYTHWQWEHCVGELYCDCKSQDDLFKVHNATMMEAFRHVSRNTGEIKCNDTFTSACFPAPLDIPFVGSDLTLPQLQRMREHGLDPLIEPTRLPQQQCSIDSAQNIRKIRTILSQMSASADYRKMRLDSITNYWASCQRAQNIIQQVTASCPHDVASDAAWFLQICLQSGIQSEVQKLASNLKGRLGLQACLAFLMSNKQYIIAPVFSDEITALVAAYPDYKTYVACMTATDPYTHDAALLIDAITVCWLRLTSPEGQPLMPNYKTSTNKLLKAYKWRSDAFRAPLSLSLLQCAVVNPGCTMEGFVKSINTDDEVQDLLVWTRSIRSGRCCAMRHSWVPELGLCDNSQVLWDAQLINCLKYCALANLTDSFSSDCVVQPTGQVFCRLADAYGKVRMLHGYFTTSGAAGFVQSEQPIHLKFHSKEAFLIPAGRQTATCSHGAWRSPTWALPSARGSCSSFFCSCPYIPHESLPMYCRRTKCTREECCKEDLAVTQCSPDTGGSCKLMPCFASRGPVHCDQGRCVCNPGFCARMYGYKKGHCANPCKQPTDCSPDTGYTCGGWDDGDGHRCLHVSGTQCVDGRCLCKDNMCAKHYGYFSGRCFQPGQLAELQSFHNYGPTNFHTLVAACLAGLLAGASCLTCTIWWWKPRVSSDLSSPLIDRVGLSGGRS